MTVVHDTAGTAVRVIDIQHYPGSVASMLVILFTVALSRNAAFKTDV